MNGEDFLNLLDGVRKNSHGSSACCPAHDDSNPSLSISLGNDGRVLVHCHAGCTIGEICGALGLQVRDLFPAQNANPRVRRDAVRKRQRERDKQRRQRAYQGVRIDLLPETGAAGKPVIELMEMLEVSSRGKLRRDAEARGQLRLHIQAE